MTTLKKLVAALTAITSMASLGVGTISASAADLDAINEKILNDTASNEEKFVAEYANDSEEMKIADYVINSGISESDAELAMQIYEDGARNADDMDFTNVNYYSNSNLASTQHYMLPLFYSKGLAYDDTARIKLNTSMVTYGGSYTLFDDLGDYIEDLSCGYSESSSTFRINLMAKAAPSGIYYKVSEFPISYTNNIHNEWDGKNKFTVDNTSSFEYHVYAIGDVDHNGVVDSTDSLYILKYVVGSTDLGFDYLNCKSNISGVVNREAADYDNNGDITVSDVVALNKYLAN